MRDQKNSQRDFCAIIYVGMQEDKFDCPDCMHAHKHGKADENGFCSNQSTRSVVLKKTLANKTDIFFLRSYPYVS